MLRATYIIQGSTMHGQYQWHGITSYQTAQMRCVHPGPVCMNLNEFIFAW